MKSLAFVLLVLVVSLILTNLPAPSYADPNLDVLLRIATQARDNINIQLSQLPTVSDEINQLYKQGSEETDALSQSVSQADQASSKEHFLSAMKIFKEINDKISSFTPAVASKQSTQIDTLQLMSEINRIQNLENRLEKIAVTNNVKIDFTKFNQIMQDARQNLDVGNADQVSKDLQTANQLLLDAHQLLADAAKTKASDRAKDFTEKQIQRLSHVKETNPLQNVTQSFTPLATPVPQITNESHVKETNPLQNVTQSFTPLATPVPQITNESQIANIPDMIVQLKQLVSEGKIDEALKLIKLIETLQNPTTSSQVPVTETPNSTQPVNVNNVNTSEITNSVNNSTVAKQNNQTQSGTVNNVNTTQNSNIVNNPPHIDNEKRFHEKIDNQTQSGTVNNVNTTQNSNIVNNPTHIDNKKLHQETNLKNRDLKKIRTHNSRD